MTTTINGRTPEEIKKGLECCMPRYESKHWVTCSNDCPFKNEGAYCRNVLLACNKKYIQQLEAAQPKWISVEERLPEESVTVLVYRDGCCGVSRLLDVEPVIMWTYTGIGGDPTHWMPLPQAPKEDV